jgi:hypothetical protein
VASPIPLAAPVTIATLPSRRLIGGEYVTRVFHALWSDGSLGFPRDRAYDFLVRLLLALASALAAPSVAVAGLSPPARVTLDGVSGARPGMNVSAVSAAWGMQLRPNYEVRPTCGAARIERRGIVGQAIFMPRGRFGAVFFRKGAVTGKGIRIGSTLAQMRRAYPKLSSRRDRYIHGGRNYFLRRARPPHWEIRVDVSPEKRVTQIAFGERASVRLDEGCA